MSKKEQIIEKLKENGCRITKQRLMLIDIILENDCSSCKEIFYKASKADHKIGVATVYRMINALEEIGAISRKNMYRVECSDECARSDGCEIVLDDNTTYHLSLPEMEQSSPGRNETVRVSERSEGGCNTPAERRHKNRSD